MAVDQHHSLPDATLLQSVAVHCRELGRGNGEGSLLQYIAMYVQIHTIKIDLMLVQQGDVYQLNTVTHL